MSLSLGDLLFEDKREAGYEVIVGFSNKNPTVVMLQPNKELEMDLIKIGWIPDEVMNGVPPLEDCYLRYISPPKGSDSFGSMTDEEFEECWEELRKVLTAKGIKTAACQFVPAYWKTFDIFEV